MYEYLLGQIATAVFAITGVLAGRPNLLMTRELYATPILLGCTFYTVMNYFFHEPFINKTLGLVAIFGLRAAAIHWNLVMPGWLTSRGVQGE